MDRNLKAKIEGDENFRRELTTLVAQYTKHGFDSVGFWTAEWDVAHDLLMSYAPMTKADFEKLEKGHPRNFILPMTTTQITTAATFISQVLFGQDTPHKVEPRGAEDEVSAEYMNALLQWNAEQQPTFLLGYLWVQDALTYNRGIFYNSWAPIFRPLPEVVEATEVDARGNYIYDNDGNPSKYTTVRNVEKKVGAFSKYELVSPYDWFCDPSVPMVKFQQGRYAGHRFKIAWAELERRSKLPVDDPAYVLPIAVEEIRKKRNRPSRSNITGSLSTAGTTGQPETKSRSYYERMRSTNPLSNETVNKNDAGMVECVELWARLIPKEHGLHDGESSSVFQVIIGNGDIVLAVNESSFAHGMFPYSVAESRPTAHYPFGPGFAILLKGLQDHVDYLKNRHQEALQRTIGNVFIVDPSCVDTDDFMNPDKEGLLIPLKAAAQGRKISEVIQQVAIKDMTERFPEETDMFVKYAETVSGATAQMQGVSGESDSATEFAGVQQMAAGRLNSVARLISVEGIVPQTKQIVSNFQQFLEEEQRVRYTPDPFNPNPVIGDKSYLTVSRDTVQGEFDFVAHDGTLPGTDARKVAALTRIIEVLPVLPQMFAPAPGNIDPKKVVMAAIKASGLKPDAYKFDDAGMASAAQGAVSAQLGVTPEWGGQAGNQPAAPPAPPTGPGVPGPSPSMPAFAPIILDPYASAAPSEIRPASL